TLQAGQWNPLVSLLATYPRITRYGPATQVPALMDASGHVGDAPERARQMAEAIRAALAEPLPQRAG
ncbi:hypothetical protein RY27_00050, partial [Litorilinea aerophila]